MITKRHGFVIELEGVNSVGKSVQSALLMERLKKTGHDAVFIKFPRYELHPSGFYLNLYLRGGNPRRMTPYGFQKVNIENRHASQKEITGHIERGKIVVLEGWTTAGLVWGEAAGLRSQQLDSLREHSCGLCDPEVKILLHGKRFASGKEVGHKHEENDELTERAMEGFHRIARLESGWKIVFANQPPEKVHEDIWGIVSAELAR